jgi:hypothetical protein
MKLAILAVAGLALAGCTTAQIDQGKALARTSIDIVCTAYPPADFAFQQYAATGRVPVKTINAERAAVAALAAICADPPRDTATAIASASRVFTALLNASAEARRAAGA